MPKFTVDHDSQKPAPETFEKVKEFLLSSNDLKKYDSSINLDFDEAKMTCHIKGRQFKANMNVVPQSSGSKVSIVVDLPFLLTPFKSKVEESLTRMLSKYLG